eukprot:2938634-Prymnesium_polylepis.1
MVRSYSSLSANSPSPPTIPPPPPPIYILEYYHRLPGGRRPSCVELQMDEERGDGTRDSRPACCQSIPRPAARGLPTPHSSEHVRSRNPGEHDRKFDLFHA